MKKYLFKSERLGFRLWLEEDSIPFAKMNSDSEVMEFFPKTLTLEESNHLVKKIKSMFSQYEYGLYAVDELETGEFIGFIGFWFTSFESYFTPALEIGWRIRREKWFKGYATEGGKRCLKFGFETLNFSEICSLTSKINLKSEKVMQKIGMVKIDEFDHPKIQGDNKLKKHVLYKAKKPF
ncbi:MAG: N-acetyltransferase [Calditrichaeota bacterium]|nr:MAG: N-acetyltransferase [Calditrichota bacterium]